MSTIVNNQKQIKQHIFALLKPQGFYFYS